MRKSSRIFAAVFITVVLQSLAAQAINPVLITNVAPNNGFGSLVISGKYLYSVGDAFRIFDISNPANPVQVGTGNIGGFGASGLAVSGNHAFVLTGTLQNYYGAYLSIFDISNPLNPIAIGQINSNGWFSVGVSGQFLYLGGGGGIDSYYVYIYDISNPANPVNVVYFNSGRLNPIYSIAIAKPYAYLAGNSLVVCDVSDPSNPTLPPQNDAGGGYDIALSGNFAYLATGDTNYMSICDISNPTNQIVIPNYANAVGNCVVVWGNYTFTSGTMGLRITDISNPRNAKLVFNSNPYYDAYTPSYQQNHMVAVSGDYAYQGTTQGLLVYSLGITDPPLSVSATSTNVLLCWATPTGAFLVQQNPDLNPAHWTTLTNTSVVVGSQNQVTIPKPPGRMFYRLASQ
jgi:hypothetical protein